MDKSCQKNFQKLILNTSHISRLFIIICNLFQFIIIFLESDLIIFQNFINLLKIKQNLLIFSRNFRKLLFKQIIYLKLLIKKKKFKNAN